MRKGVWLFLTSLVLVTVLLVSCGGAATPTTQTTTSTGPTATTTAAPVTTAGSDKPKYGGTFTHFVTADTSNWDPAQMRDLAGWQISFTNEPLMMGDWAKGPAGSNESTWQYGAIGNAALSVGQIAESYEIPDNHTLIFHIRKGIHWWNKPPANGREFTAQDAVWNIKTQWAFPGGNFPNFFLPSEALIDAVVVDSTTIKLTFPPGVQGTHFWEDGQRCYMMLPELYPKQNDWHYALGTGPFTVKDFVASSEMVFQRNPDYWQKNPVGPGKGDQLPYIDTVKILVLPDLSTRLAAFRTGKLDALAGNPLITWEDFGDLQKTVPYKVGAIATYGANLQPTGREDKDLPFKNLQVRQAMNLAIDKQAILKDYYEGHGDLLGWPYYNTPEYKDLYTPLDQLPANVQELVKGGNVDKAKQLLKDAGYPNGFKTNIYASNAVDADFLSIIKEQLLKVNIELDIRTVEAGTFRTMEQTRSWPEMWYKASKQYFLAHYMFELRPESQDSAAFWDSKQTRDVLANIAQNLAVDDKAWRKALKDVTPFMLEQSISIWLPISEKYIVWQPWVKNFHGEVSLGAFLPLHFLYYTWIDQDLLKSLGH